MTDGTLSLVQQARDKKLAGMKPEQREARERVDARNEALQSGPIKRGPTAPKDGTFGGKPREAA